MRIDQFCSRDLVTIDANDSARAAATRMRDRHVGALVVTRGSGQNKEIAGIVTDRDLVMKSLAGSAAPADEPVAELMSPRIVAVPASASLGEAAAVMHEEGVRRLLVAGTGGELVGIATLDDLMEAFSAEMADLTQALRTGLSRERSADPPKGASDETLSLPTTALARRWRQITSP